MFSVVVEGQVGDRPRESVVDVVSLESGGAGPPDLPGRPHNSFLDWGLAEETWGPGNFVVDGRAARMDSRQQRIHVQCGVLAICTEVAVQGAALVCQCSVTAREEQMVEGLRRTATEGAVRVAARPSPRDHFLRREHIATDFEVKRRQWGGKPEQILLADGRILMAHVQCYGALVGALIAPAPVLEALQAR